MRRWLDQNSKAGPPLRRRILPAPAWPPLHVGLHLQNSSCLMALALEPQLSLVSPASAHPADLEFTNFYNHVSQLLKMNE